MTSIILSFITSGVALGAIKNLTNVLSSGGSFAIVDAT